MDKKFEEVMRLNICTGKGVVATLDHPVDENGYPLQSESYSA